MMKTTGLPLDPKMVADVVKEELTFMRGCQVYHEVPVSHPDMSGLKAMGTRCVHTDKGDAAHPFVRAPLVAQETKRVSELTPDDASCIVAASPPLDSLKFMLSTTGDRRAPADVKVLGFYDISNVKNFKKREKMKNMKNEKNETM